jgi:hypothetical protein
MSEKSYVRGHFRKKRETSKEEGNEVAKQNIDYYYRITIDGMHYQTRDREKAIDELKRFARNGSEEAKKRLMDISTDSWKVPDFLRERARDY